MDKPPRSTAAILMLREVISQLRKGLTAPSRLPSVTVTLSAAQPADELHRTVRYPGAGATA